MPPEHRRPKKDSFLEFKNYKKHWDIQQFAMPTLKLPLHQTIFRFLILSRSSVQTLVFLESSIHRILSNSSKNSGILRN
jgi:hypothetical protein